MAKKLDIVLFGATGFTGKHAIPMIAKFAKTKDYNLSWGIAGRSEKKLKEILKEVENKVGSSFNKVPIIIADVEDERTIRLMARQARVIIDCCGPFRFYGETVVKACIEEGTHFVDVSGEIQYVEEMQMKYHKQAEQKGVYIISTCGFDSIPADLGVVFLQKNFAGTLNSVELYVDFWEEGKSDKGSAINFGTWESIVHVLGHTKEIKEIRRKLFPKRLPSFEPKLKMKLPHKSEITHGWVLPARGVDRPVVNRSQRYFYERNSQRPIQIESYFSIKSFMSMIALMIFASIFLIVSKCTFGRKLLLKYPEMFSFGFISKEAPNEERTKNGRFSFKLYGEGWSEKLSGPDDKYTTPPDKAIIAEVKGTNPAYGATVICLVLAAVTVLTETEKMPTRGGVYPPGYAFADTSLVKKLTKNGVTYEILQQKKLGKAK